MNEKWLIEVVIMAAMSKDYPEDEPEEEETTEAGEAEAPAAPAAAGAEDGKIETE